MNLPALFCCTALLAGISSRADAATYLEASRLDDAYPPGSTEVCIQDLPGDGKYKLPTRFEVKGKVISRTTAHTIYHATAAWISQGENVPGLTLTYIFTQRKDETGHYSMVDPASMSVTMLGAGPGAEKTVLEGMRQRLSVGEQFSPYSETEITDFPSYVAHKPGEPPIYCHKEKQE